MVALEPETTVSMPLSARIYRGTRVTVTVRNLTDELYSPRRTQMSPGE
jgi:hypothetical protein